MNLVKKQKEQEMLSEIEDIQDQMEREKHLIKVLKLKINMKNWQSKIQVIQET